MRDRAETTRKIDELQLPQATISFEDAVKEADKLFFDMFSTGKVEGVAYSIDDKGRRFIVIYTSGDVTLPDRIDGYAVFPEFTGKIKAF